MTDEKELVPARLTTYGLSNEIPANDKRQMQWETQRFIRGYDDTEMWCLTSAIAKFLLPRIKDFKEHYCLASPNDPIHSDFNKIIRALELVIEDNVEFRNPNTKDGKAFLEGWKLFHDHYLGLWC